MYRKDFTQLNCSERDDLADAFNDVLRGRVIEQNVALHATNFDKGIHWGPAFLPWHRYFLREFELALQKFKPRVTLPYWDWTRADSRDLDKEPWESFFGGRDNKGGRFDHWTYRRNAVPRGTLPRRGEIINELRATTYYDYRTMETGSHLPGHTWTGGDMNSLEAPNDPLFYLHHCNLDRLWAIWQQNNSNAQQYSTDTGHPSDTVPEAIVPVDGPMIGGETPASVLDYTALDYRYERDVLLEIAWYEAGHGSLLTGDRRSPDLFVRNSASDTGEYPSPRTHWQSPDIWVRNEPPEPGASPEGQHQAPIVNAVNYMYVNVRNRGSARAEDISVEGFHCNPGTGMLWPDDFESMGKLTLSGGIDAGNKETVGPFLWTPDLEDHECLLAVVDSPDDPTTTPVFHKSVPHWQLVRFDNSVGQRNVSPVRVTVGGEIRSQIRLRGGLRRSNNRFELDARALPADTIMRLRVASSVLKSAKLTALEEIEVNQRFATAQMRGRNVAVVDEFELAARENKRVQLTVDFSLEAKHGGSYPLIARQIQDGEIAGELTIEFTAIKDFEDYVFGNPTSWELHTINCPFWPKILPRNKVPFLTVQEGIARRYNGCRFCLPEYDTD